MAEKGRSRRLRGRRDGWTSRGGNNEGVFAVEVASDD